jgi:polysaccharide deacetylase 2 family uncharacterized protein YibQ
MPRDELRQPLRKRSLFERLWAKRPSALAAASLIAIAAFGSGFYWLSRIPHPLAGEPVIAVAIPPLEEIQTSSTEPAASEEQAEAEAPPEEQAEAEPAGDQQAVIVISGRRSLRKAPVSTVLEVTSIGQLPRVRGGTKPSDVYARSTPLSILQSDQPKIAILLGGMGLNAKLTERATKELPGEITFAFAPYGEKLQDQVDEARDQGHEVMLQVPMEPVGYPGTNPGPRTLLVDAKPDDNRNMLHWHMSRFTGYTGIVNYMGGRFLLEPKAAKPVLDEMKKRGLYYLEDATVSLTASSGIAKSNGLKVQRSQIVIDADPAPESIAQALKQLESEARANGMAVATGSGLAVTIDAVAEWARSAQERGILLVPISAAYKGSQS